MSLKKPITKSTENYSDSINKLKEKIEDADAVLIGAGAGLSTLRADDKFVEDEGWHIAAERYQNFLRTRQNQKILFLELGVGYNTPVIIKYPFRQMTAKNPKASYVCINMGDASCPDEIKSRSICIDHDIKEVITDLLSEKIK